MPYYVAPKPRNALLQVFLVSGTKGSMSITYFLGRMTQIQPNGDSKKMAKTPSFGQRGIGAASMMIGLACVMGLPNTASTATSGAWDIHVHTVVKKPSRSELGDLNTRIHIHYRYHSGIPPHRFFVAVASPQQTFPPDNCRIFRVWHCHRRHLRSLPSAIYSCCWRGRYHLKRIIDAQVQP